MLEVCASHSEKTDYDGHGWKIARLYARKIQAQLDRGLVTWTDFDSFRGNPHPSELIAAKQELDQKLPPRKVKKTEEGAGWSERDKDKPKGQCPTWNTSKVEKKCDWLVKNPDGRQCNRKHECSYCAEKGHGKYNHQRTFCAKRINAGDS